MIRLYTFLIFGAIAVVLLYISFVMPQPAYVSDTTILVSPQNVIIASNAQHTINNIVLIAQQSVARNTHVIDYDGDVRISRIKDHDAFHIVVRGHTEKNVRDMENSIIVDVRQDLAQYYNIGEDFSLSILTKDVTAHKTLVAYFAPYVLMFAISIGAVAAVFALFYMIDLARDKKTYSSAINAKNIFDQYHTDHVNHDKIFGIQKEEVGDISDEFLNDTVVYDKEPTPFVHEKTTTTQVNTEKSAQDIVQDHVDDDNVVEPVQKIHVPDGLPATPSNLPVVDLDNIGFSASEKNSDGIEESESTNEPTEEELKARLNELLNGKL